MKKTDWKGNEIEVGQTVLIVNVKNPFAGSTILALARTEDGAKQIIYSSKEPEYYQWNVFAKYKITEPGSEIFLSSSPGIANEIPINHFDFWVPVWPSQIICIEGISDNYEDYYRSLNKNDIIKELPVWQPKYKKDSP